MVDGIHGRGELTLALYGCCVAKQRANNARLWYEFADDNTSLLVAEASLIDFACGIDSCCDDRSVVVCGFGERHQHRAIGLWLVLFEAVCVGEDHHLDTSRVLCAELLGCRGCEVRYLLGKHSLIAYLLCKAARHAYRLLRLDGIFKLDARNTSELLPGAQAYNAEQTSHHALVHLCKLPGGGDVSILEFSGGLATNAPDILNREFAQHLLYVLGTMHIATTSQFGILLAELRCYLGESFCGCYTDRNGYGCKSPTLARYLLGIGIEVDALHTSQIQKRLVYGVDLHRGCILLQHPTHSLGHISVESHIAREDSDIVLLYNVADFE